MPQTDSKETEIQNLADTLQAFLGQLKQQGFNIGIEQYSAVQNVLVMLAAQGLLTEDFARLKGFIAPIVCQTPDEQDKFAQLFADWLQSFRPAEKTQAETETEQFEQEEKRSNKQFKVLAVVVMLGVLLFPVWQYLGENIGFHLYEWLHPNEFPTQIVKPVTDEEPDDPIKPEQEQTDIEIRQDLHPDIPLPELDKYEKIRYALYVTEAVLFLLLLWYGSRYYTIQRFLKRHGASTPPKQHELIPNLKTPIYSAFAFKRAAQQLRKHRELDFQHLDIEATVKKSVQHGGLYSPVYQAMKALPEYLVLIDRSSFNDQLSQFVDHLLNQLDKYGLFIERYYFDGDPRRCYPVNNPSVPRRLEALQLQHHNHRLLIFADSQHFIDPITGKPCDWLSGLRHWEQPFLFTPESAAHWDFHKQQLQGEGFVLLSAGQSGLEVLVRHLDTELPEVKEVHGGAMDDFPPLLVQRPRRFLERHEPQPEVRAQLLRQLRVFLGDGGLSWLAACAVYPELHWRLTLYLGQSSDLPGFKNLEGLVNEALLLRLIRLPWLRYGYMPDWLRALLLDNLPKSQEKLIRERLQALLSTSMEKGKDGDFALKIADNLALLSMTRQVLLIWRNRADDDSPLQDYVFQSFMSGRLAVKLPKTITQISLRFGLLEKIRLLLFFIALLSIGIFIMPSNNPLEKDKNLQTDKLEEQTKANPKINLAGSKWHYIDEDTEYDINFFGNGLFKTTNPNHTMSSNNIWEQNGNTIYLYFNNRYSVYKGEIKENIISGAANSKNGKIWKWKMVRMDSQTSSKIFSNEVIYKNKIYNFSFAIPETWARQNGEIDSANALFMREPVSDSCSFQYHITKMQENFPTKASVNASLKAAKEDIKAGKLLVAKRRDDEGIIGWEVEETGVEKGRKRIVWQAYDLQKNYYNFMAASYTEKFENCRPQLRKIIDSIKFNNYIDPLQSGLST